MVLTPAERRTVSRTSGAPRLGRLVRASLAVLALGELAACSFVTGVPSVERVRVTAPQATISAGSTNGITVIGEAYDDAGGVITHRRRIVNFTSRSPAVATVSGAGVGTVIGVAPGTAWIVGESGGKRDSVLITVTPPQPIDVRISPEFPRVRVGGSQQVQVTPLGAGGTPFSTFTLGCTSSVPTVFTAETQGTSCVVRGITVGNATLRVTINGLTVRDYQVVVEQEQYTRISATPPRSVLRETEQVPITVRLFRSDNTEISAIGRPLTFTSSNVAVVAVDGIGTLRAVGEGNATITVTGEQNVTTSFNVQVTKIPAVALLISNNPLFRVGATNGLRIEPLDSLNRVLSTVGRRVEVTVSDPSVLRITNSGLVTPLAPGSAAITVTVDGQTARTNARVTEVPIAVLRIDSTQVRRSLGSTFQYTVTLVDSLGARVTGRNVRWSSNNPAAVSIEATTGLTRAIVEGAATIRAVLSQADLLARDLFDESIFTAVAGGARVAARAARAVAP